MTCYEPVKAYRSLEVNPETGKRKLVLGLGGRLSTGVQDVDILSVPCGRCRGCRADRARDWGIRCSHEAQMHYGHSVFITLTYADEHLPEGKSVCKEDVQLWMKRLRKAMPRHVKLRFYGASEYGEKKKRPHYHYVVYGYDFPNRKLDYVSPAGHRYYQDELLTKSWGKGIVNFSNVTFASARYCAGYVMDKEIGVKRGRYDRVNEETGEVYEVSPEFATMSLKPGIGYEWFQKYGKEVWPDDFVIIDGHKMKPPAYYETLIDEELLQEIKRKRKLAAKESGDGRPDRLAVREECFIARFDMREKRLDD